MDKNKNFLKTVLLAFHPGRYDEISERRTKDSFKYFFSFMFVAFILLIILSIPLMLMGPGYIDKQLSKFDKLDIKIETEMNDELHLTESNPKLLIDTRVTDYNFTRNPEERYIITDKHFYYKNPFNPFAKEYNHVLIGDYKNVLDQTGWYSNILVWLFVLMIPSILVLAYIIYAIKYLLLILIASAAGIIIARLLKFNISFARLFKVGIYAITPAVLLELIGFMLNFSQYQLHHALFLLLFILGAIKSGNIEELHEKRKKPKFSIKSKKKKKSREYVEIKSPEE
ncbi:hypothetical protein ACFL96_07980 [Thermoproteota archaeon]